MKVNFLIVGTQKGGTTALAQFLSENRSIYIPEKKEIHFFDRDKYFNDEAVDYEEDYHCFFSPQMQHKIIGEATPIYMYYPFISKRIKEYNPNVKLVFILRNPIDRAYSHYNMMKNRNIEQLSFLKALTCEKKRTQQTYTKEHKNFSYVDRGFYTGQIRNMLNDFSREQMFFIKNEKLRDDPRGVMTDLSLFLEVDSCDGDYERAVFSNQYEKMGDQERNYLRSIFSGEINELEQLLGWDCSDWK